MKIISHRGLHRDTDIKENTLAAFERALRHGVSGIETDIRLSADGQPILYHDRLAPDQRPVETVSRRQLEDIARHEIPTLGEALATWPDVLWDLEVKCRAALPITIDVIRKHARPDRIIVTSFCHGVIAECARQLDVACGLLIAARADRRRQAVLSRREGRHRFATRAGQDDPGPSCRSSRRRTC